MHRSPNPTLVRQTLEYHEQPRPGKLEVVPTKSLATQHELSLAYTPGVAIPCTMIAEEPEGAYRWTNKGNLVAVITNGTAVLGLGDIGPLASKPVMEGKAVLFKMFAGIDVFDIEVDEKDPDEFVRTVERIAPTFGGINLEDIKAPECFEIERRLKESLPIPVFHDDQHGTAIIAGAALLNAAEVAGKRLHDLRIVVSGAGAAGIACIEMFGHLGIDRAKVVFSDSRGVVYRGRKDGMNAEKEKIAVDTPHRTLAEALVGADLFLGLSGPDLVTPDMVRSMAPRPIVFAMANPDPEIAYPDAVAARPDVIMATGRSDYPNQVNNVLCFPFMFRGALDVGARSITEGMKLAAARALAALTKEEVPDGVIEAYGGEALQFGPRYLIPKPFDHRVLLWVAPAVAEAAVREGHARLKELDVAAYRRSLERYLGGAHRVMAGVTERARRRRSRVAFAEADEPRVLRAAYQLRELGIAAPVLVGEPARIRTVAAERGIDLAGMEIVHPHSDERRAELADLLYRKRWRRGMSRRDAAYKVLHPRPFALMMLDRGDVDCAVTGVNSSYPESVRDALQLIGTEGAEASAVHVMVLKHRTLFLADTSLHIEPSARQLADIAVAAAAAARDFDVEPRVAVLSFSNFGSVRHESARRAEEAVRIVRRERPDLVIDGEMHADVALSPAVAARLFPDSLIRGDANVIVCPDLASGNIGYKLLEHLAGADAIGPMLRGLRKPVVVSYQAANAQTLVHLTAIALAHRHPHATPSPTGTPGGAQAALPLREPAPLDPAAHPSG
jgi:malate dehydrogenase (oxaloacetate-decarboxylating)(NADP+)